MVSSPTVEPSRPAHPRHGSFFHTLSRTAAERWQALPAAWRSPRTLTGLALVLALFLLLAFHQVLAQAVQQAEARQVSSANRAGAMTRCMALPDPALREPCEARARAGIVPAEPPLTPERMAQVH
jgi:hypothetical protein